MCTVNFYWNVILITCCSFHFVWGVLLFIEQKIKYVLLSFTLFPLLYLFVYDKGQYSEISYFLNNFCFVQDKESLLRNFVLIYKGTKRFVFSFTFYFFINFTYKGKSTFVHKQVTIFFICSHSVALKALSFCMSHMHIHDLWTPVSRCG